MDVDSRRLPVSARMLWRTLTSLCEWFLQAVVGLPIALRRLMLTPGAAFHFAPHRSVAFSDVVRWDEWLDELVHRRADIFEPYAPLTESHEIGQFGCTIREVEGLGASKSPLEKFADLDDMALQRTKFADDVSSANLHKNLQWRGNWMGPAIDEGNFERFLWDGRIFWNNNDGSHHFVAARYLAGQLGIRIELKPRSLTTYALVERNVRALLADWDIFVVEKPGGGVHYAFTELLARLFVRGYKPPQGPPGVYACLRASGVAFFEYNLHAARGGGWGFELAIFLPRNSLRARRAANVFRESGTFDLGAHLDELCARQLALRQSGAAQLQANRQTNGAESLGQVNTLQCVYCRESKPPDQFNREHVLQDSMGTFAGALVLSETVCQLCNDHFGKTIDRLLARDSHEGFMRVWSGLKDAEDFQTLGLNSHVGVESDDPHVTSGIWKAVPLAGEGQFGLKRQAQMVVSTPDGRTQKAYPANALPTPAQLASDGFLLGACDIRLYGSDLRRTLRELQKLGYPHGELGPEHLDNAPQGAPATIVFERSHHFRAAAKVAFNYFAYLCGSGSPVALCPDFDELREYVRYDRQPTFPLVKIVPPCAVGTTQAGVFNGAHWIALARAKNQLVAEVCYFSSTCYRVLIGSAISAPADLHEICHVYRTTDMTVYPIDRAPTRMHDGF